MWRNLRRSRIAVLTLVLGLTPVIAAAAGEIPRMIVSSYTKASAYVIDNGKVVWEYRMPGACQDAWMLPGGNVLVSGGNQVVEVTRDKQVVWKYESPAGIKTEIHSCQPLPGGSTLIGEGGMNRLIEVDRQGQVTKEVKLNLKGGAHLEMRIVRKTPQGTYLVVCPAETAIIEFDSQGRQLRRVGPAQTKDQNVTWKLAHSVEILENGNWLIGTSYGATLFEIDKQDRVVWTLTPQDVPELGFVYAAAVDRLPDGTIVVAAYNSKTPIFAVNRHKKVPWTYQNPQIGAPTNVKIIERPTPK